MSGPRKRTMALGKKNLTVIEKSAVGREAGDRGREATGREKNVILLHFDDLQI